MTTLKQSIARWENALRVLRSIPDRKFYWMEWGQHEGDHDPKEKNYCGTTACIAGWCSLDPWFRRRGLKGTFTSWGSLVFDDATSPGDRHLAVEFFRDGHHGENLLYAVESDGSGAIDGGERRDAIWAVRNHIKYLKGLGAK